jgi:hypothetical protein
LDYHELGGSNDGAHCNLKGLVAIDTTSGAMLTVPVQKKGSSDLYAVESVCHWLKELGYPRIVIRSDNEPSIRDFVGKVVSVSNAKGDHLQIVQETSPRHSSQSNGAAERAIQTTDGILRTMKDDIETTVGQRLDAKHPVLAWMLRHTGWLHTRFQRHAADGRTSFEKLRLRRYVSPLVAFGERVHCRHPGKTAPEARQPVGDRRVVGPCEQHR